MKAPALFLVFALAKAAALLGHSVPVSWWTPAAYLWQDAVAALLFALFEWIAPKRISAIVFWGLTAYAALNIPVTRAVATPLTIPMLHAAGGPLADSLRMYFTWTNAALVLATFATAATSSRLPARLLAGVPLLAALGPFARTRVDTLALGQNVVEALAVSALPHVTAQAARAEQADWRGSRFESAAFGSAATEDLSGLRGLGRGRNVILLGLESTAAQYLRLYGGPYDTMPNLGALAEHAVVFDNAYAAYPESIKGLYSILCSTYPAFDSEAEDYDRAPCHSIAQTMAEAGYRTALFHSGRFGYLGMQSVIRNRGYQTLEDAGDIGGQHESSFGVEEPATVARILTWIDALPRGQRFFVTYLPIAGHHPYETPERGPFAENGDIGRYRNALHYGDAALGALRNGLRARGLDGNTVWVVYGDHGEAFGQHKGNYAHTFFLYEENVHVPLLIAAPGGVASEARARQVASLVDLAPTLLDVAGLEAPASYQGRSVLNPEPRMALFFTDYSLGILGLRDGPWKFIQVLGQAARLYDLIRDPGERRDLAATHADQVKWYGQQLRGWSAAQKSFLAFTVAPRPAGP